MRPVELAELFALRGEEVVLLSPTAHAARTLQAWSAASLPAADVADHLPFLIQTWEQWTHALWMDRVLAGREERVLLNHLQEEQIWASIIRAHPSTQQRLPSVIRDLAIEARRAYHMACAHGRDGQLLFSTDTAEAAAFASWTTAFREHCRKQGVLSAAQLETELSLRWAPSADGLSSRIYLIGFERLTPPRQQLLSLLQRTGTTVEELVPTTRGAQGRLRQSCNVADPAAELRFATECIAETAHSDSALATTPHFAIVLADAKADRGELVSELRKTLAPELDFVGADLSSTPWMSATPPELSREPLVATALHLLQWIVQPLSLEQIGQLLLSPFIGYCESLEKRARFEARSLRQAVLPHPHLDLFAFDRFLAERGRVENQATFPELRQLALHIRRSGFLLRQRSPADWTEFVRELLQICGWPGRRSLTASEYHVVRSWEGLLDLLATLQIEGRALPFTELLQLLIAEANRTPGPVVNAAAPIQILAFAQTEGLCFDQVLLLGANDRNVPTAEPRLPLLSPTLQAEIGVGDSQQSLTRWRSALHSLADRSERVVLISARGDGKEEFSMTPLAATLGFSPMDSEIFTAGQPSLPTVILEATPEEALPPLPSRLVRGGVEVLRLQAACGFRAFASMRLLAEDLRTRGLGLTSLERGSLLHAALEELWRQLGSQAMLASRTPAERAAAVQSAVRYAMQRVAATTLHHELWTKRYLHIVEQRFCRLLQRWLDFELHREPFTVRAQETEQLLELGPLTLKLRPDRVDEVAGGTVYIDYKSGFDLKIDHWLGALPDAPQLPAYALSTDAEDLKGIAFARVRPGKNMGWISLATDEKPFHGRPKRTLDPEEQLQVWRRDLTALAEAFAGGDVSVRPKQFPTTCTYCAHRSFCRLTPSALQEATELEEEQEEAESDG